ncbi:MAG: crosslink repair DNA glycosylase YcaQ family protein [Pseudomonadota bacterium]
MLAIKNRDMRRLWLGVNGLAQTPTGALDVMQIIQDLGLLQLDTIRNVVRAQDHILWSRNQNYREPMLWPLLRTRKLFEHFTHDASLLPMELYPMWQIQFARLGAQAARAAWYQSGLGQQEIHAIRDRIAKEGPLSTHAFDTKAKSREMWQRPPHKKALEQMWYAGTLATSHRENFVKFYDLGARVFPSLATDTPNEHAQAQYLCAQAVTRLSIATSGEIQRFWGAVPTKTVETWVQGSNLVPVHIETYDGTWHKSWASADIEARLDNTPPPTARLRIINPFDPAVRDRTRLDRLFGFAYKNEMFVPPAQRRFGYYVYPLLQGDRFVGRMELKANRDEKWLRVTGFWPEDGVQWTQARHDKLHAELTRFARLASLETIEWHVK